MRGGAFTPSLDEQAQVEDVDLAIAVQVLGDAAVVGTVVVDECLQVKGIDNAIVVEVDGLLTRRAEHSKRDVLRFDLHALGPTVEEVNRAPIPIEVRAQEV